MEFFSHSRIETFNQCRLKYKYRYIDKEEPLFEKTIEAFMGSLVHEVLEKLYKDLKYSKLNSLEDLLKYYEDKWDEKWSDDIVVVKDGLDAENYREMGRKYIRDYYNKYKPFDSERTLGLEMEVKIELSNDSKYTLIGYIDRLAKKGNTLYIIDYKTSNSLPTDEKINMDRQLALYSIAVKKLYPFVKKIVLRWHYLAFNQVLEVEKKDEDIEDLKKLVMENIDEIHNEKKFKPSESVLCNWCEFQHLCPLRKHKIMISNVSLKQKRLYKGLSGKKMIEEYKKLKEKEKEIKERLELLKEEIFEYANKRGIENIYGDGFVARLRVFKKLDFPKSNTLERSIVDQIIKEYNLWEKYSTLNTFSLSKDIQDGVVSPKVIKDLKDFVKPGQVKKIYFAKDTRV